MTADDALRRAIVRPTRRRFPIRAIVLLKVGLVAAYGASYAWIDAEERGAGWFAPEIGGVACFAIPPNMKGK